MTAGAEISCVAGFEGDGAQERRGLWKPEKARKPVVPWSLQKEHCRQLGLQNCEIKRCVAVSRLLQQPQEAHTEGEGVLMTGGFGPGGSCERCTHVSSVNLQTPLCGGTILIPILRMRKPRPREVK